MNKVRVLIDGRRTQVVPVNDRGLAYGDGLFETIRFVAGAAPLWRGHLQRLHRGAQRLGLSAPDEALLRHEAQRLAGSEDCVIKLILTRAEGNGYAPEGADTRRMVMRKPVPEVAPELYQRGLRLRWCRLRLAAQPALAGLKHLNRLEQVLARAEWRDRRIDEGVLLDGDGRVISVTAGNLFVVRSGRLLTPRLDRCGVAGVARAWLMRAARAQVPVLETQLRPEAVLEADEVFICNAVRGVLPVRALAGRHWRPGQVTCRLGTAMAALGIGRPPGRTERHG